MATSLQIPSFHIIGLPAPEVAEARERVRAAIEASALDFPRRRVVVNLSPASIRKRGTGLDLAVAIAILASASGAKERSNGRPLVAWGELGLDGTIKPAGQLTRTLYACWEAGIGQVLVSADEEAEARQILLWLSEGTDFIHEAPTLIGVGHLKDAWSWLRADRPAPERPLVAEPWKGTRTPANGERHRTGLMLLAPSLERAVSIAAAGSHHLLLLGSKGAGKTHALDWLCELHPPVSPRLRIRNAILAEMAGIPVQSFFDLTPPIRRVSPGVKSAALVGRASSLNLIPGEFTLAHGGVFIADELPEWARDSRESLREPLEHGMVTLTRASGRFEMPAAFTLAATGNFCPCGGWPSQIPAPLEIAGTKLPRCRCTIGKREQYFSKLSGPILDRLDITMLVAGTAAPASTDGGAPHTRLEQLRSQVAQVRERLIRSLGGTPGALPSVRINECLSRNPRWERYLEASQVSSLRSRHKIVRVALTLSAWDGLEGPTAAHFLEAASYRPERFGFCD